MVVLQDYWRSSSAWRVRIALNLLGIAYDSQPVNLADGDQRDQKYLRINPQGIVPTLEIDGLVLTQSLAILEYLNETRQAGFLPSDVSGRARVRALAMAVAMEIQPVCNLRVARHVVAASGGVITIEGWMRHFVAAGLADLEAMLAAHPSGRYCHGDGITLAGLCLVPQVYNARRWGVDLTPMPRVAAIDDALSRLPAFAAAHADAVRPPE